MRKIYSAVFLTLHLFLFSQGENNHWYFGNGAAVNFNNPTNPQVLTNSNMYAGQRPVGSISNNNGKLLFYTNGDTVFNREHQPMMNGSILSGGAVPGIQLAILKHPANPNWYYVFNPVPYFVSGSSLTPGISNYSIIDMSGGPLGIDGEHLGEFLANNSSIPFLGPSENTFQAMNISVIQHADKNSYWVIIPNGTNMYSYLVNNQGLVNYPVISSMPFPMANYNYTGNQSYMKASPILDDSYSFSNFVYLTYWGGSVPNYQKTRVMSFDNSTGMITSDYVLEIDYDPQASSAAEFNKDGSIMYLTHNGNSSIYGIDMTSTSSPISNYLLPINSTNPALEPNDIQRNKYGDIYLDFFNNNTYLAKIETPDTFNSSSIDVNNIYLNGRQISYMLPQLNQLYKTSVQCQSDIVLTSPEINNTYTYQTVNTIKTETNYSVNASQNIEMTAGESITFLPNTIINGKLYAHIQDCPSTLTKIGSRNKDRKNVRLNLDLRNKEQSEIPSVYPNPATEFISIKSSKNYNNLQVFDISGRKINIRAEGNKIDIRHLPSGTYILSFQIEGKNYSEKFIKK